MRKDNLKLMLKLSNDRDVVLGLKLYDLSVDPAEQHGIAKKNAQTDRLLAVAEAYLQSQAQSAPDSGPQADPETLEALKALGYVQDD